MFREHFLNGVARVSRERPFRLVIISTLMVACLCTLTLAAAQDSLPGQMSESGAEIPGTKSEVAGLINVKERWLGLFAGDGHYELRPVTLRLEEHPTPGDPRADVGTEIVIGGAAQPILILSGLPALRPGRIEGLYWTRDIGNASSSGTNPAITIDQPGQTRNFTFNKQTYTLRASCPTPVDVDDEKPIRCPIVISHGSIEQTLAEAKLPLHRTAVIEGIGDLDRDGDVDLLVKVEDEETGSTETLFLSSLAGKGQLFGPAAEYDQLTE